MQKSRWIALGLALTVSLSGCAPKGIAPTFTPTPMATATLMPSVTPTLSPAPPTATLRPTTATPSNTPTTTQSATPTLPATLEPQQVGVAIGEWLKSPPCRAPCFWGITPEQTTRDEALRFFSHLGLPAFKTAQDGNEFFDYEYKFESGTSINVALATQEQRLWTASVRIQPHVSQGPPAPREWLSYSQETLIRQYGTPSQVDIVGGGTPHEAGVKLALFYILDMYFDAAKLIVEYESVGGLVKTDPATGLVRVCPVTDQFDLVHIWVGKYPYYPPVHTNPIEKATSMTAEEFSTLMTGKAEQACFNVSGDYFDL